MHAWIAGAAVLVVTDEHLGAQDAAWMRLHCGEHATDNPIRKYCGNRIEGSGIHPLDSARRPVAGKPQAFIMCQAMQARLRGE